MENIQNAILQTIKEAAKQVTTQMINDMGIDQMIDKIYTFPANIMRQQGLMISIKRNLDEAKSNLELIKQVIVAAVIFETNGDSKPRFSNEKAREAEIIRRMAVDQNYQAALQDFRKTEDEVNIAQFELDRLYNEFSAYKAVARILAGKLNIISGL